MKLAFQQKLIDGHFLEEKTVTQLYRMFGFTPRKVIVEYIKTLLDCSEPSKCMLFMNTVHMIYVQFMSVNPKYIK